MNNTELNIGFLMADRSEREAWWETWGEATNHYENVDCEFCERHRVSKRLNGHLVCEKCRWDNTDHCEIPPIPR